ncbi:uncharacterized protein LOC101859220 [Aplysia californica]|uniref:Allatostatin C n=1 Tax=Aplysia californica TaxID=6500 RepID=A0A161A0R8_APLCA|nr:uncharacterized protein LOC101859220 [Aplysia californica]ADX20596.1 allatostatin C [Aplysia californica]UKO83481.1 AstC precursor [Aplysia californica]
MSVSVRTWRAVNTCLLLTLLTLWADVLVVRAAVIPVSSPEPMEEASALQLLPGKIGRASLLREMERQLMILQAAEENIVSGLQELEEERRVLSGRKRSHYSSMCMFNVVACYRKRK